MDWRYLLIITVALTATLTFIYLLTFPPPPPPKPVTEMSCSELMDAATESIAKSERSRFAFAKISHAQVARNYLTFYGIRGCP